MTGQQRIMEPGDAREAATILRKILNASQAVTGPRDHRMRHAILQAAEAIEQGRDPGTALAAVYQSKPKPENN